MIAGTHSQSNTSRVFERNRAYETTYKREYVLKRSPSIVEGVPIGQQFLIGSPFQLNGAVGESLYSIDFTSPTDSKREPVLRPNTPRANRPHQHKGFPYWPRRCQSVSNLPVEEKEQALRNQLNSTYQVDYSG